MTGRRLFLITLILLCGLSTQALAASYPLVVKIPPVVNINTIAAAIGGTVIDSIPGADIHLLNVPFIPPPVTASLLGIQWMELNKSVTVPRFVRRSVMSVPAGTPADWYKNQPWMQLVKAGNALAFSTGQGVIVADVNSQVDRTHPALIGHLIAGYDFIVNGPSGQPFMDQSDAGFLDQSDAGFLDQSDAGFLDQSDAGFLDQSDPGYLNGLNPAFSHGTISAGVIAAVAPQSMIMPLRVYDDDGHSDLFALAKAIRYAVQQGAHVVNLNFSTVQPSLVVQNAIGFAQASNVLIVAGAGNENTPQPQYPAAFSGVLAAAATTVTDAKALFSNYGSHIFVSAPGDDIISAYPNGYYTMVSGTSLSSAVVAGTAALVRSVRTSGVQDSIATASVDIDSSNPEHANLLGAGRIDALAATQQPGVPVITGISPATAKQGQTVFVTITGQSTQFAPGATQLNLGPDVTITNVTVASPTSVTAQVSVGNNAVLGARPLTATTSTEVVTLNNAFTVSPGIAVLTLVAPNTSRQGESLSVTIQGDFTSFVPGMTAVSLGEGVTVSSVSVSSATAVVVQAAVSPAAAVGPRNVTVTTGSQVVTLNNGFTVNNGLPAITTVSPNTGKQGEILPITISAQFTNFVPGITQVSVDGGITVSTIAVTGGTTLTAHLTIPASATLGSRTLTVTTGTEVVTLANAFTVVAGTPAITSITPSAGKQIETVSITITGQFTNFAAGVTQLDLGVGVAANISVASATSLSAQLSIAEDAPVGARALIVTTGNETLSLPNAFTVQAGTPVISLAPTSAQQGDSLTVNIQGRFTNFAPGTTQVSLGDGITVNGVTVWNGIGLSAQVSISPEAAVGPRTVTVTTGAEVVTLNNAFTVNLTPPVITSANPGSVQQGQNLTLSVTGQFTHFAAGATQLNLGPGITASITVASRTSLTALLSIADSAALGSRTLTVITGAEIVTLSDALSVMPGSPTLSSASPNNAQHGESKTVNIQGRFTNFVAGTTQVSFGDGVTVSGITVSGPTALTAQITISTETSVGPRTVTVTTGAEILSLNNGFTVNPRPPVITSVSPNAGQQGQNVTVAIAAQFAHFTAGVTQINVGGGIIVNSLTVNDPNSLTAQLMIPAAVAPGSQTLSVMTGSEVVTIANAFTVTPGTPVLTGISANTGKQVETVMVTITGQFTHFAQGSTQVDLGPGIAASVMVAGPNSLTAQLNIAETAATGARTVIVTTGAEVVSLANVFTVAPGSPALISVAANNARQAESLSVSIQGRFTNFAAGTTLVTFGDGITVNSMNVTGPNGLTAQITVTPEAVVGPRPILVMTGAEVLTLNNAFTVNPSPPVLSALTPNNGQPGQTVTVVITGQFTHFAAGQTYVGVHGGIMTNSVTVHNATSLTAQLTIPAGAVLGPQMLAVLTGHEFLTVPAAFIVTPATPQIPVP
jgi:hypothetical protein